jgi:hypothetical protein
MHHQETLNSLFLIQDQRQKILDFIPHLKQFLSHLKEKKNNADKNTKERFF